MKERTGRVKLLLSKHTLRSDNDTTSHESAQRLLMALPRPMAVDLIL